MKEARNPIAFVVKNLGIPKIVVNCVGTYCDPSQRDIEKLTLREWKRVIDTNIIPIFNVCKAVFPFMKKLREGVVVNVSSLSGIMGTYACPAYAAAKAAIIGFSYALLTQANKYGIRVNIVAPGPVRTKIRKSITDSIIMYMTRILKGTVLSKGIASGVSTSLEKSGEIIVAKLITPIDCLKIVNAKGIIVEEGGKLSHIAIYARELGIPCIRLENATQLIPPGRMVKIYEDGTIEVA